jgi:DUF1016 N-terminal domain
MSLQKKNIYADIQTILQQARESAVRSVNFAMVIAYWKIGERIVEEELKGKKRAEYGEMLMEELSKKLTTDFGKGFTVTNIKYMRLFYIAFPIRHALRDELKKGKKKLQISHALRDQSLSKKPEIWTLLRTELSWKNN